MGYIDRDGQTVIPFIFDEAGLFASGLAPAKIEAETGFIDRSGKFAFHLAFKHASGFLTGNAEGLLVADSDVSRFWTADGDLRICENLGKGHLGADRGISRPCSHPRLVRRGQDHKLRGNAGNGSRSGRPFPRRLTLLRTSFLSFPPWAANFSPFGLQDSIVPE